MLNALNCSWTWVGSSLARALAMEERKGARLPQFYLPLGRV